MKKLDKSKIYDLSELRSEELKKIFEYLKNTHNWDNVIFEDWSEFSNLKRNVLLCESYGWSMKYNNYKPCRTTNAKELFYTLENIQVDCTELTEDQIMEMANVYKNNGFKIGTLNIVANYKYLNDNNNNYCVVNEYLKNKTTITYDKFIELFGNKEKSEEFNKLVEVLNEELTEEAYKGIEYEVKYIAEKPKQYQIGIDTFQRCEANMTKEEILACVRFNIDKYNFRVKGQDLEDLEKIIAYANWGIKQLKK